MKYIQTYEKHNNIERIYINSKLSEFFEIQYDNDGESFITHVDALIRNNTEWDTAHKDIFQKYRGKTLNLKGDGMGWWKIINAR